MYVVRLPNITWCTGCQGNTLNKQHGFSNKNWHSRKAIIRAYPCSWQTTSTMNVYTCGKQRQWSLIIEEDDGDSDVEWLNDHDPTPGQPLLQDTIVEEDRDQPSSCGQHRDFLDLHHLEREETDLARGSCSSTFSTKSIECYWSQCCELSRAELDMAILGNSWTSPTPALSLCT